VKRTTSNGGFVIVRRFVVNSLFTCKAEAMVTPRRKYRGPAMVTPKSYPYP